MKTTTRSTGSSRPCAGLLPLAKTLLTTQLLMAAASPAPAASVDRDGDGASDFWQAFYQVPSIDPGEDTDNDGVSNGEEASAGTDPLDPASVFRFHKFELTSSGRSDREVVLAFDGVAGKTYQIQGSSRLEPRAWSDVGAPIPATADGRIEQEIPIKAPAEQQFFRVLVVDRDEDGDGLTAFEEALVGTSDRDPDSGGQGDDATAGFNWLKSNEPGADPAGGSPNLHEVDVAWVRQPDANGNAALLVSAAGTGGWHQLTSWRVPATGIPTEAATTPPIDGHHAKIKNLEPDALSASTPKKFVTGRIRDNGDLWLSSRALAPDGSFVHYRSVGYGRNADVDVFDYDIAQRPMTSSGIVLHYQIVTPLMVKQQGSSISDLRIVTWQVDVVTGHLTGLADSGPLAVYDLPSDPEAAHIRIAYVAGNQFSITYTSEDGSLSHHAIWTDGSGVVTDGGGGTLALDIRGNNPSDLAQEENAVEGLTSSGYLTANRATNGTLTLKVWDRRLDDDATEYQPFLIADNELDLGPNANGVFLPTPTLTDSWNYETGDGDHFGQALAVGDFDGDGYKDVAIGAPTRDSDGSIRSGAVYIIGGSSDGLADKAYDQIWTQDSAGVNGVLEVGDLFGYSLAAGDFNGDQIDDLAIGVAGEDVGNVSAAGSVNILYGTPFGLASTDNQSVTENSLGHVSEAFEYFGWAVASGDFNGDSYDDLAISAPNEIIGGHEDAGAVFVMWGSRNGLSTSRSSTIHQNVTGLYDQAEDYDGFGRALAAGDFNGDGRDDLAIGIPREDIGSISNAGAVQVLYGSQTSGFGVDVFFSQAGFANGEDIHGAPEQNDFFGESLAVGDFDHDGAADLAVGAPGEDVGDIADAGAIHILYGSFLGLTWFDNLLIQQDEFNPTGGSLASNSEEGDDFGRAITVGDFDGDGIDDLVVGAPHESLGGNGPDDAGAIFLIRGSPNGPVPTGSRLVHQDSTYPEDGTDYGANGSAAAGDQFGATLAAGDFNADGETDLIVGIPRKDRDGQSDCGAIQIIPGSELSGLTLQTDEEWFPRLRETVSAKVADLAWEEANGIGGGVLYRKDEFLKRHVASVTKTMTVLLTVEAIENGQASFTDLVTISDLAGGTGGSKLGTYDANGDEITDSNGDEIPFIQPGDTMPLRLLLGGMMNQSCNRSSVAIGQHIAEAVHGDPDEFINMMNDRAAELHLDDSVFGHPAGGWVTTPQDMITLLREGAKHPLFLQLAGIELYGVAPPSDVLCGTDSNGDDKCNGPFAKFTTIGDYPGRLAWKGGNGGLWFSSAEANDVPTRPAASWCTASAVGIVRRLDRTIAMALQQTENGSRTADSQRLLDYGFRKIFTPDARGSVEFPKPGGLIGPDGPVRVRNFAIDRIDPNSGVTAIIDDNEELKLNIWKFDFGARDMTSVGTATRSYALLSGATFETPRLVDLAAMPAQAAIEDFFSANLNGDHLDLAIWRVGENP